LYKVSLQDVDVKVSINGFVASVVSKLTYVNDKDEPVEGTFTFPMEENSAVYHFQAEINDLVIIAECMDKKQVRVKLIDGDISLYFDFLHLDTAFTCITD
jgi:hypothetical protein